MTKYKKTFQQMLEENKRLFSDFESIHNRYVLEPQKYQEEFNRLGRPVAETIKTYEDRLCGHSEKGMYGKFSANLAEKFRELIRQKYPKIDFVGVIIEKPGKKTVTHKQSLFDIPKIKLL